MRAGEVHLHSPHPQPQASAGTRHLLAEEERLGDGVKARNDTRSEALTRRPMHGLSHRRRHSCAEAHRRRLLSRGVQHGSGRSSWRKLARDQEREAAERGVGVRGGGDGGALHVDQKHCLQLEVGGREGRRVNDLLLCVCR